MNTLIYQELIRRRTGDEKSLAVLIDPDKSGEAHLRRLLSESNLPHIDFIFVGGSLLTSGNMHDTVCTIRSICTKPIVIFPGDANQIDSEADAILLLSLISGRNPELLIGKHVTSAIHLKRSGLEIISTGYMLIDGGVETTASYVTGTSPLPSNKPGIAAMTGLAGEQLGLKVLYMDAGSGAREPVPASLIHAVRSQVSIPIIVGGGIRNKKGILEAWNAGADVVVIGNALEENPELLPQLRAELIGSA